MASGIPLIVTTSSSSPYETLALLSLWALFIFFLTTARFSEGSHRERAAFIVSFAGGFLMLLVPLYTVLSRYPVLPPGGCGDWYLGYYCLGTLASDYYSTINLLMLAAIGALMASLLYALHSRAYIISIPVLLLSGGVFLVTVLSTQLPMPTIFLCGLSPVGGLLMVTRARRDRKLLGGETRPRFSGQIIKVLTKPVATVIILAILIMGTVGGLWGYASEAAGSVQVTCQSLSLNPGPAADGTVGLRNPSYVPLDGVWKITYTYTGEHLVFSDTKAFHIPPQGTIYVSFGFAGSGQRQTLSGQEQSLSGPVLITTFERHYNILIWSFDKTSFNVVPEGFSSSPNVGLASCAREQGVSLGTLSVAWKS